MNINDIMDLAEWVEERNAQDEIEEDDEHLADDKNDWEG